MIAKVHMVILLALAGAMLIASVGFYPFLPERVPTHWGWDGQADGFGSKWIPLALPPGMFLAVGFLLVVLPPLGPFRKNFEQFRTTYGRICVVVAAGLLGLHLVTLLKTTGYPIGIGSAIAVVIGLMLAVMGNWLGKVRRNFYIGIRTPWTLANDEVWDKTHRLGGKLFVVHGLATVAAGLLAPQEWMCFVVLIGGLSAVTVWAVLYSLYWYRRLGQVDDLGPRP